MKQAPNEIVVENWRRKKRDLCKCPTLSVQGNFSSQDSAWKPAVRALGIQTYLRHSAALEGPTVWWGKTLRWATTVEGEKGCARGGSEGRAPDQLDGMVVGTVAQEICRLRFEEQGGIVEGKKVGGPFLRQRVL